MPTEPRAARRLLGVAVFAVGLYVYTATMWTAAPSVLITAMVASEYLWPDPTSGSRELSTVGITAAISSYLMLTSLAGLSGMLAGGGLWWDGSKNAIRFFITAGLLGSLGHSLPAVIGAGAGLWYDVGTAAGLVALVIVAFPTVAYAVLAALTFVVLGGPPSGTDAELQSDHG